MESHDHRCRQRGAPRLSVRSCRTGSSDVLARLGGCRTSTRPTISGAVYAAGSAPAVSTAGSCRVDRVRQGKRQLKRATRSLEAERIFRDRMARRDITVLDEEWHGCMAPRKVMCAKGHVSYPRPNSVTDRSWVCDPCNGRDPDKAWADFKDAVARLGGRVTEENWLGANMPHAAVCEEGHRCRPTPTVNLRKGKVGICRTCAGNDPAVSRRRFIERITRAGGSMMDTEWRGVDKPHWVRCVDGHDAHPRPRGVLAGQGFCLKCANMSPEISRQKFLDAVARPGGEVIEPTWLGSHRRHRVKCARGHEGAPIPRM